MESSWNVRRPFLLLPNEYHHDKFANALLEKGRTGVLVQEIDSFKPPPTIVCYHKDVHLAFQHYTVDFTNMLLINEGTKKARKQPPRSSLGEDPKNLFFFAQFLILVHIVRGSINTS